MKIFVFFLLGYWCCPEFFWVLPVYVGFTVASASTLFYFSYTLALGAQDLCIVLLLYNLIIFGVVVLGSVSIRLITLGILVDLVLKILARLVSRNSVGIGVSTVGNRGAVIRVCG